MRHISMLFILILFGQIGFAHGESQVFEFVFEGPYTLQPSGEQAYANIPVRMAENIRIEKLTATFGTMDPIDVSRAFTSNLVPPNDLMHAQLKLTVDLTSIPQAKRYGTYKLFLDVSYPVEKEETDDAGNVEKVHTRDLKVITLALAYPETKVYAPQPLLVLDTWFLSFHSQTATSPLSLEVSEGPALTSLAAYQANPAKMGNDPVVGQLKLADADFLNGGRIARLPVAVETGFPLGDASGTIQMSAPGMQRTEVAFTVKTRQHSILIPIIAAIGLFLGFVLRIRMESQIESRQNKIGLQRLLLRVQQAQGLGKEAAFAAALTKLAKDIESEIRNLKTTPSDELPEKMTKLDERLKSATTDFTNKQNTMAQRNSDCKALLLADWRVPPAAKPQGDLTSVQKALDRNDLDEANRLLAEFEDTQSTAVITALEKWYEAYLLHFSELGNVSPPLPESAEVLRQSKPLPPKQKIPAQGRNDLAVIKAALVQADQDYQLIAGLVESMRNEIYQIAGRVKLILSKGKYKESDLQKLTDTRERLALTNCAQTVDAPDSGFKSMAAAFQAVTNEMWDLIEKLHPKNTLPDPDRELLQGGKYEEAAARAIVAGQLGTTPMAIPLVPVVSQPAIKPPPDAEGAKVALKMPPAIAALESQIQKTWQELAGAKAFQSIGAGLGLIMIAYLIFADTFVGHPADFMKIFLWGFTTDIGVNVLLEKAKGVTPKK